MELHNFEKVSTNAVNISHKRIEALYQQDFSSLYMDPNVSLMMPSHLKPQTPMYLRNLSTPNPSTPDESPRPKTSSRSLSFNLFSSSSSSATPVPPAPSSPFKRTGSVRKSTGEDDLY